MFLDCFEKIFFRRAGVVVFTLGDAKGRAFFNPVGIAFILAGSLSDAMAANYEEKVFFSRWPWLKHDQKDGGLMRFVVVQVDR